MIQKTLVVMLLGLVAGTAWAGAARSVDVLEPTVRGLTGDAYVEVSTPAMPAIPAGAVVRKAVLEFEMDLPAGTTLELWHHGGEGLPWDGDGTLVDSWTLDERTGDLVRFRLSPDLYSGASLWVRLDPADEGVAVTAETLQRAVRVIHLGGTRRPRP